MSPIEAEYVMVVEWLMFDFVWVSPSFFLLDGLGRFVGRGKMEDLWGWEDGRFV